ncbi:hypothetical protein [Bacillus sp. V2I10]|uniref:hypothetical protein n=1 Tax=Bacillus sp. V2I10 TaxID=3042276 RepID=UPI00277F04E6|nr:hypothetical protein [Bacillus sp. V2I10]MDQ0862375.1 hypothetical protein [Bacillus sp. V2I10]
MINIDLERLLHKRNGGFENIYISLINQNNTINKYKKVSNFFLKIPLVYLALSPYNFHFIK